MNNFKKILDEELRKNLGTGGECICKKCDHTQPHKDNVPCFEIDCPKCGEKMERKEV